MPIKSFPFIVIRTPFNAVSSKTNITNEQLYISSQDLFDAIQTKNSNDIKKKEKIASTLEAYKTRSKSRCTPFGLFAGVGIGPISEITDVELSENNIIRHTRFDSIFILQLIEKLNSISYLEPLLKYYTNETIYQIHENYYYTEYYYKNFVRKHKFNKIEADNYLKLIIENAQNGLLKTEIVSLIKDEDITESEKYEFVSELINNKILLSELSPAVTGIEIEKKIFINLKKISQRATEIPEYPEIVSLISNLENIFLIKDQIDKNGASDQNISLYYKIIDLVKQIDIPYNKKHLFQIDYIQLYRKLTINNRISNSVIEGLSALIRLYDHFEISNLKHFREQFYLKWQDEEIPLIKAIDTNYGIGYPVKQSIGDISESPFIDHLPIENKLENKQTIELNDKLFTFWSNRINTAILNNTIINIKKKDLEDFNSSSPDDLPATFSVLCSILDNSDSPAILIKTAGGSSAIPLISRFANYDENINLLCKTIALKEEELYSDCIIAEISHFPDAKAGNIIQHPHFYKFNISYLNNPLADKEHSVATIGIDDIVVKIVNNRIQLSSKKFNKQIIPKLSNAHAYFINSQPIYHFLCDMQFNGVIGNPSFHIPQIEGKIKYTPRVTYEDKTILSAATWNLSKTDITNCFEPEEDDQEKMKLIKKKWNIPDFFVIVDGENELLINTNKVENINLFFTQISSKSSIKLEEYLFDSNSSFVKSNNDNSFNNEIIFCYYNDSSKTRSIINSITSTNSPPRQYHFGSEWIYYKIYCNSDVANEILISLYLKVINKPLFENKIVSFFFIRFKDPHYHVRIRIKILNLSYFNEVLSAVNELLSIYTNNLLIWKIQTETYEREVDRYGVNTIDIAEKIFYIDSVNFITTILEFNNSNFKSNDFYYYCLLTIDTYLTIFTKNNTELKLKFCYIQRELFKNEFKSTKFIKQQLDKKYRIEKNELFDFMKQFNPIYESCYMQQYDELRKLNRIFSEKLQLEFALLKKVENNITIENYLVSYIHMCVIRFCKTKNRIHEYVFYDTLEKYYRYSIGLLKHNKG
jgi:thiopeptide-type bacteriocin biosynthesis protein